MPKITAEQLRRAAARLECMSDKELDEILSKQSVSPDAVESYAFLERWLLR